MVQIYQIISIWNKINENNLINSNKITLEKPLCYLSIHPKTEGQENLPNALKQPLFSPDVTLKHHICPTIGPKCKADVKLMLS